MRKIYMLFIICLFLTDYAIAQNNQWQNLFNGKDLTGWKVLGGTATL
jgi:hypothetical protein